MRAPLPSSRSEVAVIALNGKVYVIGGLTPRGGITNRVEAYDPVSDKWEQKADLPVALHHTSAASINGHIYVLAGLQLALPQLVTSLSMIQRPIPG